MISVFIVKIASNLLFSHLAGKYGESYMSYIRQKLLAKYNYTHYHREALSKSHFLYLNSIIPKVGTFNWSVISLILKALTSLTLLVTLFILSFKLILTVIFFTFIWGIFLVPIFKWTRSSSLKYFSTLKKIQEFIIEHFDGYDVIKISGLEPGRLSNFNKKQQTIITLNSRLSISRQLVGSIQEFLIIVLIILFSYYSDRIDIPLPLIITYGYIFTKTLSALNEASVFLNNGIENTEPTREVVLDTISYNYDLVQNSNTYAIKNIHLLNISNLNFQQGDHKLFDNVSLEVSLGEKIQIIGNNGTGKSTFLKAVLMLINTDAKFKLNNEIFSSSQLSNYHSHFSYLPQDDFLFQGSVVDNIFTRSTISINKLNKLLLEINIDLNTYFSNYQNYRVEENGKNLSGGQRKIICLLRVLIEERPILILDEFSNHLSKEISYSVQNYLKKLEDVIILSISHEPLFFINKTLELKEGKLNACT
jgi:ABC-type bacteriocin/lantibiotic exporter with double-glycine peptidase domain